MRARHGFLSAALLLAACGKEEAVCPPALGEPPTSNSVHVAETTVFDYPTSPAAGGPHFPAWLRWAEKRDVVHQANYVHNLEHGGVILINPCEEGCDEVSDQLELIGRSLPQDSLCASPINARWAVVRDPKVDSMYKVALAAWGHIYSATCFDETSIRSFIDEHYGNGPEATCAQGSR